MCVMRVRIAVREDSPRERSPAVSGQVRNCRDMSPSLGLSRARYSRAVLESGWHVVLCVAMRVPFDQHVSLITCCDGRPPTALPGPRKVDSYYTHFSFAF